jgi:hypothetical protein
MTATYVSLLRQIEAKMHSYGMALQPPCPSDAIRKLNAASLKQLSHRIPDGYANLLALMNGLDWNGLVIYASHRTSIVGHSDRLIEGFIDGNLAYRDFEPMKEYLVFGDDGTSLYVYHTSEALYQIILSVGLSVMESFESFESMIATALEEHL